MDLNEKIAARRRELQAQARLEADAPKVNWDRSTPKRMGATPGPSAEALDADPLEDPAERARIDAEVQHRLKKMEADRVALPLQPAIVIEDPEESPALVYALILIGLLVAFYSWFIGLCLIVGGCFLLPKGKAPGGPVESSRAELEGLVKNTFSASSGGNDDVPPVK